MTKQPITPSSMIFSPGDSDARVLSWVNSLAKATIAGSEPVTPARIVTVAALLTMDRIPMPAYCEQSLHIVAQDTKYFPAYADLRKMLLAWWADNSPAVPTLPSYIPIRKAGLTDSEYHWVRQWYQRRQEGFGAARPGYAPSSAAHLSSLIREVSANAWAEIVLQGGDDGIGRG